MEYQVDVTELKKEMLECGISKNYELAKASGVGKETIGKILKGKYKPSYLIIVKIANALHFSPEKTGKIFFACNLLNK